MRQTFQEIKKLTALGHPIFAVLTTEEERFIRLLKHLFPEDKIQWWSLFLGLQSRTETLKGLTASDAIAMLLGAGEKQVLVLKDVHPFLSDPHFLRGLRDAYAQLKGTGRFLFLTAPSLVLPDELRGEVQILELPLPGEDEIRPVLQAFLKQAPFTPGPLFHDHCVAIMKGLKLSEIELSLKRTLVDLASPDEAGFLRALMQEKVLRVRMEGVLEAIPMDYSIGDIGGLENLKEWLAVRERFIQIYLRGESKIIPKGLLLMGISGCGKSLSVKAISDIWKLPLFRLDMNLVFSESYGPAEQVFHKAVRFMESVAPAILWIDEIEMGISAQADTGVAARIFAKFLTWMQERKEFVFVAATANRIDLLPAEMIRRGRFDQVFFVDLPSTEERKEILQIHLKRRGEDLRKYDFILLAQSTESYSGAEIEQIVVSGAARAISEARELTQDDLYWEINHLIPLATTMQEQIKALRSWARKRAISASKGRGIMDME
jgi:ATP-dependent 26S proteasome regulatory subunit